MAALYVILLLAVGGAAWLGGSMYGMRKASRARTGQTVAERRVHQLEAEARQLGAQLEAETALLERLPDPAIVFGADRSILRLNAAARSVIGGNLPALLRHPGFRAALERAHERRQDEYTELSLPVPIARELSASVLAIEGPPRRLLALITDRTREHAVERMRADFVANASHELRTPLTSLIGFIDTLRGPAADDPAAQARFLGIMAEQAQRMKRLIDDLLSLSRVELTEHVPPHERVALDALAEQTLAGLEPLLEARRTRLEVDVPPSLPRVTADEDQLAQVLQNLVENAAKYGREDGLVRITAKAAARGGQNGVALRVSDDGPGIAALHLPRLTERFYRVNTHRSRSVGGTGLGLAIVKHIVNRHRGHLKIESVEGSGTTVTIWLPEADPAPSAADPRTRPAHIAGFDHQTWS